MSGAELAIKALDKVPTGVNTLGWLAVLLFLFQLAWRNRTESNKETTHLREEMIAFTDKISAQNDKLILQIEHLEQENKELRDEVRGLQSTIDGLRRQQNAEHYGVQRAIIDSMPVQTVPQAMKDQLHKIVDENVSKEHDK